jgi:hypothetical protein
LPGAEVFAGLPAELLAERGQDRGACAAPAVDERSAAGALKPVDLLVEAGLPEAECLGGTGWAAIAVTTGSKSAASSLASSIRLS